MNESNSLHIDAKLQGGKYVISKVIGEGGFGITYLGRHTSLKRRVAIKEFFMKEYCERDADTSHMRIGTKQNRNLVWQCKQKFLKEALMIAKLDDPHIIRIYDIFEENDTAYYVMEYVDGGSLEDLLNTRGRLNETAALDILRGISAALRYIHNRNILHLDIKPSNIMMRNGTQPVLIDFGVSKHYDNGGVQTSTTPVARSKGYAPVEQYAQGEISLFTPSTDIYSLGAVLYKMLTGTTPPESTLLVGTGISIPGFVSAKLRKVIAKAMAVSKGNRYQSVEAMMKDLNEDVVVDPTSGEETVIGEPKPVTLTPAPTYRRTWLTVVLHIVAFMMIGITTFFALAAWALIDSPINAVTIELTILFLATIFFIFKGSRLYNFDVSVLFVIGIMMIGVMWILHGHYSYWNGGYDEDYHILASCINIFAPLTCMFLLLSHLSRISFKCQKQLFGSLSGNNIKKAYSSVSRNRFTTFIVYLMLVAAVIFLVYFMSIYFNLWESAFSLEENLHLASLIIADILVATGIFAMLLNKSWGWRLTIITFLFGTITVPVAYQCTAEETFFVFLMCIIVVLVIFGILCIRKDGKPYIKKMIKGCDDDLSQALALTANYVILFFTMLVIYNSVYYLLLFGE